MTDEEKKLAFHGAVLICCAAVLAAAIVTWLGL